MGVDCAALFVACYFCHAEVQLRRPSPRYVTGYYLLIATGGVLGSLFVGVLASLLFPGTYELYCGLAMVAALGGAATWNRGAWFRLLWMPTTAAMLALLGVQVHRDREGCLAQVRSFYGSLRVVQDLEGPGGSPSALCTTESLRTASRRWTRNCAASRRPTTAATPAWVWR